MKTVDEQTPRIGVFVCHCGTNIGGVVNVPKVVGYAKTLPDVVYAEENLYTCSSEGFDRIKDAIRKYDLNRVVVASCTPRTHEPLFRNACVEADLNKYLFQMANIREQCSWVHARELGKATEKAKDIVRMAVAKARLLEPLEESEIDVEPSTLIIGGGIAGLTAALCLANRGFKAYVVEKEPDIGGMLRRLHTLYPTNQDATKVINEIITAVNAHENIKVFTSTTVRNVEGFIGNFNVTVQKEEKEVVNLKIGTIIVATGASNLEPIGMYGYKEYDNVITQLELERLLKTGQLKRPEKVVMIQCVGAREREGRTYCSRICCMVALKNAMLIKELYPDADLYILYRDLQIYGEKYEEYWRAREKGIKFIKYHQEKPPEVVSGLGGKITVNVYHVLLGEEIKIESDLVVLSTPLIHHQAGKDLSSILRVPLGPDEFFFEAHGKLRPVDFATDGIYLCGTAQGPKDVPESVAQAYATASRAGIPMAQQRVTMPAEKAIVEEELCSGCSVCVDMCPYKAIDVIERGFRKRAKVIEAVCKGCGLCAAHCPTGAIQVRRYKLDQVLAQVDSLLMIKS